MSFSAGAEALDADNTAKNQIADSVKLQLRFIQYGAVEYAGR
jgi:hypothetical protein